jgi:hypothetical protein
VVGYPYRIQLPNYLRIDEVIVKAFHDYKKIYVYDLGMTKKQLSRFYDIEGVQIKRVPKFTKYYLQCWSWKIWIFKNCPGDKVLYLDAGNEVLNTLESVEQIIDENGYFLVSQYETLEKGHTLEDIIPKDFYNTFKIPEKLKNKHVVAAGIIGFSKESIFYKDIVSKSMKAVLEGFNLGWSKSELNRNQGINRLDNPKIRDCNFFRHDQTIINIYLYKYIKQPAIQSIHTYGEYKAPYLNKGQVIWNSRTNSNLTYTYKIKYNNNKLIRNLLNYLTIKNRSSKIIINKLKSIKIKLRKILR